jgi:hypothetical protein
MSRIIVFFSKNTIHAVIQLSAEGATYSKRNCKIQGDSYFQIRTGPLNWLFFWSIGIWDHVIQTSFRQMNFLFIFSQPKKC